MAKIRQKKVTEFGPIADIMKLKQNTKTLEPSSNLYWKVQVKCFVKDFQQPEIYQKLEKKIALFL